MKRAIYPGSFDPVTYGHIEIIKRASEIFDELIVGILENRAKTPLFSLDERVNILKEVLSGLSNEFGGAGVFFMSCFFTINSFI